MRLPHTGNVQYAVHLCNTLHTAHFAGVSNVLYVPGVSPRVLYIAEWRARKGLSQAALARAAGVSRTTVSNLELGKADGIEWDTLDALAKVLGASRGALFSPPLKTTDDG